MLARYNLSVVVSSSSGAIVDSAVRSIGFREAVIVEEPIDDPDNPGTSFYVRVNGVSSSSIISLSYGYTLFGMQSIHVDHVDRRFDHHIATFIVYTSCWC